VSINLLLVDDHAMLREGIKQLLEFDNELHVVSQASNGEECLQAVSKNNIDIVLLDINLPDVTGTKLIKDIKRIKHNIKVLMLTVHNEMEYLLDAMDLGCDGYILKDSDSDELIKAIKMVYSGERYIQPELVPSLNVRLLKRESDLDKAKDVTKREKQILISIAQGKSNKDIADSFDISERTVKNHITSLFKKIGVTDRTQAAVFAIRNNYIDL